MALPKECSGFKRISPPAFAKARRYYDGADVRYYKKGKVVLRCNLMHGCVVHRKTYRKTSWPGGYTEGYSAGPLHSACAAVQDTTEQFGSYRKRRR